MIHKRKTCHAICFISAIQLCDQPWFTVKLLSLCTATLSLGNV